VSEHKLDRKTKAVFALIITSDTRDLEDDETGRIAIELIEAEGHKVANHTIVPNDSNMIRAEIEKQLKNSDVQVIVTSGGTGISSKDRTVETATDLFERELPGFGELFRRFSYDEVSANVIISRSVAGIAKGKVIFCLPGSKNAVRLALSKIILPSLGHALWELNRL
jgi:molybdenum cofactor biosynthesis protein B